MSKEVIMLAKPYNEKKVTFPCVVSEKLDGVAVDLYAPQKWQGKTVVARSRQNEVILSVEHITGWLTGKLPVGAHLICELYIPKTPFKDISGKARSHDSQEDLVAYVYDYYVEGQEDQDYYTRMEAFAKVMGKHLTVKNDWMVPVRIIPGKKARSLGELERICEQMAAAKPDSEGVVIRNYYGEDSHYGQGKRSWGMQKRKRTDTIDLEVVGFEEALEGKTKAPKGMVGRIVLRYHTGASSDGNNEYTDFIEIGCGPGKLTHAERTEIWNNQEKYLGKIAEVSYMPDDSYEALREARFIRWRDDKTTPSQE